MGPPPRRPAFAERQRGGGAGGAAVSGTSGPFWSPSWRLSVSVASVMSPGSGVSTTVGGAGGGGVGVALATAIPPPIAAPASADVTAATTLLFRFSSIVDPFYRSQFGCGIQHAHRGLCHC